MNSGAFSSFGVRGLSSLFTGVLVSSLRIDGLDKGAGIISSIELRLPVRTPSGDADIGGLLLSGGRDKGAGTGGISLVASLPLVI